jgi:hypothetical protein
MQSNDYLARVEDLFGGLACPSPPVLEILEKLHRFGVWSLGGAHPRGSLTAAARNRLPSPDQVESLWVWADIRFGGAICRKALLAIGQWGGQESLHRTTEMMEAPQTDAETQLYCIAPLRNIGGPKAVRALARALSNDRPEIQDAAMSAILDLAAADSSVTKRVQSAAAVDALRELRAALTGLQGRIPAPLHLRPQALKVLAYLGKTGLLESAPMGPLSSVWDQQAWRGVEGGPLKPDDAAGAVTVPVLLERADRREEEVPVKIIPMPEPELNGFERVRPFVYVSQDHTVVIIMQIPEEIFPEGIAAIRVSAVVGDGTEARAEKALTRGAPTAVLEFRIPEAFRNEWCEKPEFRLREA